MVNTKCYGKNGLRTWSEITIDRIKRGIPDERRYLIMENKGAKGGNRKEDNLTKLHKRSFNSLNNYRLLSASPPNSPSLRSVALRFNWLGSLNTGYTATHSICSSCPNSCLLTANSVNQ